MSKPKRPKLDVEPLIRSPVIDASSVGEQIALLQGQGDAAIAEGLDALLALDKEILNSDSPFMRYVRETRKRAVLAVKKIVDVKPDDAGSVVAIQGYIGDYYRVLDFAAKTYQVVAEGPEREIEDEDRLEPEEEPEDDDT